MNLDIVKSELPEFDMETGVKFCGGDPEFLAEILEDYIAESKDELLAQYFEEENWDAYAVDVHGLKGSSRTVGFTALGDECEVLQFAAEAKDAEKIKANHPAMMEHLTRILNVLKNA